MPRLLTSLLVLLLGAWPTRATNRSGALKRRGSLPASRPGTGDEQDPVEAPARARARSLDVRHWPGELIFSTGDRRTVVRGQWGLTFDPVHRARAPGTADLRPLDPEYAEVWETQLEALLMLQVPGARLKVVRGNSHGWQLLEVRASTNPETVVQLDRVAVAQLLDAPVDAMRVELRVMI